MTPRGHKVIGAYVALEKQASHLVALAKADDWQSLLDEGQAYVAAIAALADAERGCQLTESERDTKYQALERTLDYDLELRTRLLDYHEHLAQQIARARKGQAAAQSYGAVDAATVPAWPPNGKAQP